MKNIICAFQWAKYFKMKTFICIAFAVLFVLQSCQPTEPKNKSEIPLGMWRAALYINDSLETPFLLEKTDTTFIIYNADEKIEISDYKVEDDSIQIQLPIYPSYIKVKLNDSALSGYWKDLDRENDYQIPISIIHNKKERFEQTTQAAIDLSGKWQCVFRFDEENPYAAIAEFTQDEKGILRGTFITKSGDYRYLEGVVSGTKLMLSTFDGSHAYLFTAEMFNDTLQGKYYSGKHYSTNWIAFKNAAFELPNPYQLTQLIDANAIMQFDLLNLEGKKISSADIRYKNKVLIVQVSGSWCPNCKDEGVVLAQLYEKYKQQGLEIVALCFERSAEFEKASKAAKKLKKYTGANYEFLIAGKADKETVKQIIPIIDDLKAYPTSFFLDRNGKIKYIHTGFSGPGTSEYLKTVNEIESRIVEMLKE
jgi:thiol-disulfide isomerase/thioredoxin